MNKNMTLLLLAGAGLYLLTRRNAEAAYQATQAPVITPQQAEAAAIGGAGRDTLAEWQSGFAYQTLSDNLGEWASLFDGV